MVQGAFPAKSAGVRLIDPSDDFDTTLVRRGVRAATFRDMEAFVSSIEQRPLDKLVGDLPGLAQMSEMKFNLARQVLRRRMRDLPPVEVEQLRIFADEVSTSIADDAKERIRSVFVQRATA